ncbi:hypothetical protein MATR_12770 [Marivirga tractuosa]|uniref:Uncharacterized protein n=1 Tax=Marivirga tractuosa (strain ATCC 23168 / DSM 4126 / NBRC 15989 / NCIMB 1408 / VKM B-1430 / H-43) TaxID=643867 RepID=E4TUY8_MARTH|nr:hypothetical protein [Marivirga tractuosa]ADR21093.1 hypothetical protein Ftrac_1098 [Marivirga tractuosa DSM 4126]BDD14452.1 hypothetical protein MATR_12770 [Marivirga tractuosa]
MKKIVVLVLILTAAVGLCRNPLLAQEEKRFTFIGINPSVTVEPFYEEGEFDINIFPVVYQRSLAKRFDIRLTPLLNLGIRNTGNKISQYGFEAALPIFFKPKENKNDISKGFFVAPILSVTRNRIEQNNIGLWIEPGYNLLFEDKFAMTFGLQLGGTNFTDDDGETKWGNHFGIKIIIGKWL